MMLALILALLAAATLAEGATLPAYVYPFAEEDPVGAAVVDYMLNNDFGCQAEEGGVLIPTPVILKTETNTDSGSEAGLETPQDGVRKSWITRHGLPAMQSPSSSSACITENSDITGNGSEYFIHRSIRRICM